MTYQDRMTLLDGDTLIAVARKFPVGWIVVCRNSKPWTIEEAIAPSLIGRATNRKLCKTKTEARQAMEECRRAA